MPLQPLRHQVLVELDAPEQEGPILVPDAYRVSPSTGLVRAVGPGAPLEGGGVRPVAVSVGQRVLVSEHVGEAVPASLLEAGARPHRLIEDVYLLAVLDSPGN